MPNLDVSELTIDPDFATETLTCIKQIAMVDNNGVNQINTSTTGFVGMVAPMSAKDLKRYPDMSRTEGAITVITRFLLDAGSPTTTADKITWKGEPYLVDKQDDFSEFGQGMVVVHCSRLALSAIQNANVLADAATAEYTLGDAAVGDGA